MIQKLKKMQQHRKKNEKTSILGRALFGGRPPEGFGRVLGGFRESFERIWGGFWKSFGKMFKAFWMEF